MASTRRVFLEILGAGAAASSLDLGCVAIVTEGMPPGTGDGPAGGQGTGGTGGGGAPIAGGGSGGSGTGGQGTGTNPQGTGGNGGGGKGQQDAGGGAGSGGSQMDAGAGGSGRVDARAADGPSGDGGPPMLQPGDILAGNVGNLAVGALNAISGRSVAIGRDATGIYALTLICTHQGCTASPAGAVGARQINCPCHGSQFDGNGAVRRGPANRPLVHFAVTIDAAGNIVVHSNMQIAANVRVVA